MKKKKLQKLFKEFNQADVEVYKHESKKMTNLNKKSKKPPLDDAV